MTVFLRRTLDWFAGTAAMAAMLSTIRLQQFGLSYLVMSASLVLLCILPSVLFRAERNLRLRGYLVVTGYMLAMFVGISDLGLNAVALLGLPLFLGVNAAISGRMGSWLAVAATYIILCVHAWLFVSGRLPPPEPGLEAWNRSTANWAVAITCNLMVSGLFITMVHNLRDSWELANKEVLDRTRQLEELIETAPDAIVIFDSHTKDILDTNIRASELLGYPQDRIIRQLKMGGIVVDSTPSETGGGRSMLSAIEATRHGQNAVFEANCINRHGVEIPCEISLSRLPALGSSLLRASILDITDRKAAQTGQLELQEKLAASQRLEAVGKLTGGVAHDFNNLLAVIMANLELLQIANESTHDEQLLQASLSATRRGAHLVNSMLAFAKKAPLRPEVVSLNQSIEDTHAWAGRTIPSNIEIETSFDRHLWSARVDVSALNSAVLNLILNARDAMPEGGQLTLRTANQTVEGPIRDDRGEELLPGRYVTIEVTDTGTGIPAKTMERVFEPFFTTKGVSRGSGLGLPMVFGFMGQSGGVLHVFSREGFGTSIKLYFTAVFDEPMVTPPGPPPGSLSPELSARILLVEDNVQLASTIERTLRQAGHSVRLVLTGDAAKEVFVSDPHFDLLLTDMVMPGALQGRELAAELRSIRPSLSVIFMSGNAGFQDLHIGQGHMGIHLGKPVPQQELTEAVSRALTRDRGERVQQS